MEDDKGFAGGPVRVPARFNGPDGSGNGGWSAGAFAVAAGAGVGGPPMEVTLLAPPPLETALTVDGEAVLDGDRRIAAVVAAQGELVPVAPVSLAEAVAAAGAYAGLSDHPFPRCFVCGTDRTDGLRIFPGPLPDGRTAAPWTVPDDADLPILWAALDCPGGWTALQNGRTYLLGRIAVAATALPEPGSTCVIVGEAIEIAGRKAQVNSTVYGADRHPIATARATWIATG